MMPAMQQQVYDIEAPATVATSALIVRCGSFKSVLLGRPDEFGDWYGLLGMLSFRSLMSGLDNVHDHRDATLRVNLSGVDDKMGGTTIIHETEFPTAPFAAPCASYCYRALGASVGVVPPASHAL